MASIRSRRLDAALDVAHVERMDCLFPTQEQAALLAHVADRVRAAGIALPDTAIPCHAGRARQGLRERHARRVWNSAAFNRCCAYLSGAAGGGRIPGLGEDRDRYREQRRPLRPNPWPARSVRR